MRSHESALPACSAPVWYSSSSGQPDSSSSQGWLLQLAQDVAAFKALVLVEEGRQDVVVLASKLAAVGYRVSLRTAVGGGMGQEAFRNLHHEFLVINQGSLHTTDYIVDPNFRQAACRLGRCSMCSPQWALPMFW